MTRYFIFIYLLQSNGANSYVFSSVSLTPIVESGHQQSLVEDNPKSRKKHAQPRRKND